MDAARRDGHLHRDDRLGGQPVPRGVGRGPGLQGRDGVYHRGPAAWRVGPEHSAAGPLNQPRLAPPPRARQTLLEPELPGPALREPELQESELQESAQPESAAPGQTRTLGRPGQELLAGRAGWAPLGLSPPQPERPARVGPAASLGPAVGRGPAPRVRDRWGRSASQLPWRP